MRFNEVSICVIRVRNGDMTSPYFLKTRIFELRKVVKESKRKIRVGTYFLCCTVVMKSFNSVFHVKIVGFCPFLLLSKRLEKLHLLN